MKLVFSAVRGRWTEGKRESNPRQVSPVFTSVKASTGLSNLVSAKLLKFGWYRFKHTSPRLSFTYKRMLHPHRLPQTSMIHAIVQSVILGPLVQLPFRNGSRAGMAQTKRCPAARMSCGDQLSDLTPPLSPFYLEIVAGRFASQERLKTSRGRGRD